MNKSNTDSPKNGRDFAILSLVISLVAVVIAGIAFNIPFSELSCDDVYNKAITLAGLIIGVLGAGATVYFVIMGINIYKYSKKLEIMDEEYITMKSTLDNNMRIQYNETLDAVSMLESISDDSQNIATIRLAIGKFICKSEIHTDEYPLETGIANLGQYSRSREDIDTLRNIAHNSDNDSIRDQAKGAIDIIKKKRKKVQAEEELSRTTLRWWRNKLGYIQL